MRKTKEEITVLDISTRELRKSLGEIFNRVQYGGNSYIVTRNGKPIGAIIPVELVKEVEAIRKKQGSARDKLLKMLEKHRSFDSGMTEEEAMETAVKEIDAARAKRSKNKQ
jgi:prevent-host-death family protein